MRANREAVALYERAAGSVPTNPTVRIPLSHPGLLGALDEMAGQLGYDLSAGLL